MSLELKKDKNFYNIKVKIHEKGGNIMAKRWHENWEGFKEGRWNQTSVNVRDFIQHNYTPYEGDSSFLKEPTEKTKKLWQK